MAGTVEMSTVLTENGFRCESGEEEQGVVG